MTTNTNAALAEDLQDTVSKALRRAWQLGQTYWQQADSEYTSQHRKADETQGKFDALVEETRAALASAAQPAAEPAATNDCTRSHPNADLLRAIADGKQMQGRAPEDGFDWFDIDPDQAIGAIASDYSTDIRIKPDVAGAFSAGAALSTAAQPPAADLAGDGDSTKDEIRMTDNKQYPELPTHFMLVQESFRDEVYLYTADQMRAYVDADRAMRAAKAEPPTVDPLDALRWGANVAETLLSIGRAIGFGRAQQMLGEQWEVEHDCAPRGRMGVTVKDAPKAEPAQQPERIPLTDAQLVAAIEAAGFKTWDSRMLELKRLIEAAHGIKPKEQP